MSIDWNEKEQFAKDVFYTTLDDAIEWIKENLDPNDVFNDRELIEWALDHGFVEKE